MHAKMVSQTYLVGLRVSQHDQCIVGVSISKNTTSREHKFKVMALMASDYVWGAGGWG